MCDFTMQGWFYRKGKRQIINNNLVESGTKWDQFIFYLTLPPSGETSYCYDLLFPGSQVTYPEIQITPCGKQCTVQVVKITQFALQTIFILYVYT